MKKEIKSLILKANKGDPKSQHDLAFNYWTGKNLKQDSSEAMKWWKLSASKGFGIAYFNLGRMYYYGDGAPVNYKKAYYYLNLSTKKRHAALSTAYFFIGNKFFLKGKYGKKNIKKGIKYLDIAARKKNIRSQYLLAHYYYYGNKDYNIKQDKAKALKYYKMSSDSKFLLGSLDAGLMYEQGEGVRMNREKAYNYYRRVNLIDANKMIDELPDFFPKDKVKLKKVIKKIKKGLNI